MPLILKKTIHAILFNLSVFLILFIGIQNSSNKTKINLLIAESVKLPVSFTIGISFITGSILGSCLSLTNSNKD